MFDIQKYIYRLVLGQELYFHNYKLFGNIICSFFSNQLMIFINLFKTNQVQIKGVVEKFQWTLIYVACPIYSGSLKSPIFYLQFNVKKCNFFNTIQKQKTALISLDILFIFIWLRIDYIHILFPCWHALSLLFVNVYN